MRFLLYAQPSFHDSKLEDSFSHGAYEHPLSNGKPEILVVVLRHVCDNGAQGDGSGKGGE